jgi:hypothetical protein
MNFEVTLRSRRRALRWERPPDWRKHPSRQPESR